MAVVLILGLVVLVVTDAILASRARPRAPRQSCDPGGRGPVARDPRRSPRAPVAGVWLGAGDDGQWRFARPERAVLLLGPPRSGKTSGVIIPAVLAHAGPVIVTSTKPDVARATASSQGALTGGCGCLTRPAPSRPPAGLDQLRWSPVTSAVR